ncbi:MULTISPECIES: hypothetical protein [Butyricimonas]|uniref:hypothetical protein n=1 Tax=Butyricimonas TaxID=574697 RepID=UPI001EF2A74D|nr:MULTISPECIES: hypothetical protein [Butyricimonas]MCI7162464.1 hypothetical protein [Butyricimonas virosa]MCI7294652.1 hypothetical protein [Butyricimonas virosa]MCI7391586.1 hypothetical protein [Butyricimonas virosa]MDY4905240.1 hypothetical protein [Butyricimonas virosa]MDY5012267.1 hypothetical protein [Butyricimonas virosa]
MYKTKHHGKRDLNKIYKRKKSDRDIFQELMPFKVKEILLIANYYDSYTIEREGQFSGKIFGEYLQLNLFAAPRFTSVANEEGALHELKKRHFDLILSWQDWTRKLLSSPAIT